MSNTGKINQSVTVSEYNTEHSKLFCALQALCLLHCSDVLHDSHRKVCTRCPQNLANPRDEECSCTAGTAHHLSCGPLAGVTSCPCSSAQGSSTCLQPKVPRAECAMAPHPRNCQEPVLLLGAAAKGSLRAEGFVKSTWNRRTPFTFCYLQVSAERVESAQGLGLPHMGVGSPGVHPAHWAH